MSALPPTAAEERTSQIVSLVPEAFIGETNCRRHPVKGPSPLISNTCSTTMECLSSNSPTALLCHKCPSVALNDTGGGVVVVPARRPAVKWQDVVACEVPRDSIRGGIVDLHHLIGVSEHSVCDSVDKVVRERAVDHGKIV